MSKLDGTIQEVSAKLAGVTLEKAKELYPDTNFRVTKFDGAEMIVTCDFIGERINVHVENNVIVAVQGRG